MAEPRIGAKVEVFEPTRGWRGGVVTSVQGSTMSVNFRGVRRDVHAVADVWRLLEDGVRQAESARVGSRVSVFWPGEGVCFPGKVASHDAESRLWFVQYEDGDSRVRRSSSSPAQRSSCVACRPLTLNIPPPRTRRDPFLAPEQWHDLRTSLWAAASDAAELERQASRLFLPKLVTAARAQKAPARPRVTAASPLARPLATASSPPARPRAAERPRGHELEYFPAGVVLLRRALSGSEQTALVDNALIAGFQHRATPKDALYTNAQGQPDVALHWNYYEPPPDDQPPPLSALELSSRALRTIREALWDEARAQASLAATAGAGEAACGGPLAFPLLSELGVSSLLGVTYAHSDSMHWHTDMAQQAGWCATLSVGAPADFQYVPRPCEASATSRSAARASTRAVTLTLRSGDVLLFNGGRLQHRVLGIAPVEAGGEADEAWRCAPLGPNVARLVVQARPFGASREHTYAALREAGYAPPDELLDGGGGTLATPQDHTASSKRAKAERARGAQ